MTQEQHIKTWCGSSWPWQRFVLSECSQSADFQTCVIEEDGWVDGCYGHNSIFDLDSLKKNEKKKPLCSSSCPFNAKKFL